MFNQKHTKTSISKLNYAFMVAAIASVLAFGTGYSSMQSSALDYNGLGDTDLFNGLTQTAECAGLGNDCSEDNRVRNEVPPGENPPPGVDPDCEAGIACFVDRLDATQLGALKFRLGLPVAADNALLCTTIDDYTAAELRAEITHPAVGVTDAVATAIINCLIDAGFTNLETA